MTGAVYVRRNRSRKQQMYTGAGTRAGDKSYSCISYISRDIVEIRSCIQCRSWDRN